MKNSASMRPDQLLVTTQGVRGGRTHTNKQGNCRIVVLKGFNEPQNSIWVDVYTGSGNNYSQAETAMINICFDDGLEWNGNFNKLKTDLLNTAAHINLLKEVIKQFGGVSAVTPAQKKVISEINKVISAG